MSVGCFIGIRVSYTDASQEAAERYLAAINLALRGIGVAEYSEPLQLPDVYNGHFFGRSALDRHTAGSLTRMAQRISSHTDAPQLKRLLMNPYRIAFVPRAFPAPLQ